MSYYWNNKEKILDKYYNLGGKEKAKEYYQNNKDILKRNKNKKTEIKRQYSRNRYQKLIGKL